MRLSLSLSTGEAKRFMNAIIWFDQLHRRVDEAVASKKKNLKEIVELHEFLNTVLFDYNNFTQRTVKPFCDEHDKIHADSEDRKIFVNTGAFKEFIIVTVSDPLMNELIPSCEITDKFYRKVILYDMLQIEEVRYINYSYEGLFNFMLKGINLICKLL
jgi:hypothetical protein